MITSSSLQQQEQRQLVRKQQLQQQEQQLQQQEQEQRQEQRLFRHKRTETEPTEQQSEQCVSFHFLSIKVTKSQSYRGIKDLRSNFPAAKGAAF